ncbi:MAG: uracil phosphoribosyltransferase [Patescibacteria group bacterium]
MKILSLEGRKSIDIQVTKVRNADTQSVEFRKACRILAVESIKAFFDSDQGIMVLRTITFQTPVSECKGVTAEFQKFCWLPIMRSGLLPWAAMSQYVDDTYGDITIVPDGEGMIFVEDLNEGIIKIPSGFAGAERYEDKPTEQKFDYYKPPKDVAGRHVFIPESVLATAGSAGTVIRAVKKAGALSVVLPCAVAAKEGLDVLDQEFGDYVTVVTCAIDLELTDKKFIKPGLGDYGNRAFGAKNDEECEKHQYDMQKTIKELEERLEEQFVCDAH